MSRIAILGATSQIARDFVSLASARHTFSLYTRRPDAMTGVKALHFSEFGKTPQDVVINFVGAGDPARVKQMGITILDTTQQFDELAIDFIKKNPACRYIFLSSGVASGRDFASETSTAQKDLTDITVLAPQDYYSAAKFQAEARHRTLADMPIIDLRVFNYFSSTGDPAARYFAADLARAIRDKTVFKTSADPMVRDYIHPEDFHYSRAPVDKLTLLREMADRHGLQYEISEAKPAIVNATGSKPYYYSTSHIAAEFGYKPKYSSLEGLVKEMALLFPK